jgi:phosphopantothenoylcysteine decarboxylase / phosphopantothenate---cysteine ligase
MNGPHGGGSGGAPPSASRLAAAPVSVGGAGPVSTRGALPASEKPAPSDREKPTFVLAVTGSIAAYKAAEIARGLLAEGAAVLPVMTERAQEFLGAATLSGLTREPVRTTMWDPSFPGEMHVELARRASAIVIAPTTADTLARMAQGRADDLVTALALVAKCPVLVAPSMHPSMWDHPATQRNISLLRDSGRCLILGPVSGPVASGDVGMGRMMDPTSIIEAAFRSLVPKDLAGLRVMVTAGPTVEDLDPVRFLTNRSSGKMGFSIARQAAARGAEVVLVAGPVQLPTPEGVTRIDVRGALAMQAALHHALGPRRDGADMLFMSAAVSDFRPAESWTTKRKKVDGSASNTLSMTENPDILAELGAVRKTRGQLNPLLIGFAVETGTDTEIVQYARGKLISKNVDLVVANHATDGFGRDDNRVTLVDAYAADALPVMSKRALADLLLDRAKMRLAARTRPGIAGR